jgi:hypothetical protein
MRLFTFKLYHPQAAEQDGVLAVLPARTRQEAEAILRREFFFKQDLINGHLFDVVFVRAADAPPGLQLEKVIKVQTVDGKVYEKAFN